MSVSTEPRHASPSSVLETGEQTTGRPPYRWAAVAGLAVFALYAITLAPTTATWDTSEYIATSHNLGIPHPPGNPLFVVLARAWDLLLTPLGLATAVRINLFSAVMSAGAAAMWFLVMHRVLAYFTADERVRRVGAGVSVLVSATAFTVWYQSNVNEKVYTVSFLTIALLSWLAFVWRDHVEEHGGRNRSREGRRWHDDNVLVLMIFLLSLSVGNHLMAFLAAPALLVFVVLVRARVLANWRLYAWSLVFAVLGLSVNLYLPVRSALDPVINEAAPSCPDIPSALVSVVTFGKAGCPSLSASLAREQYQKPSVLERQAPFVSQAANYFQYFDWQWARSLGDKQPYFAPARLPITLLFLGLGIFGAWQHWRRDRKSFAYLAVLFGTLSLGLTFYMNFKYGFMQAPALGKDSSLSEVRERDYFFLVSFSLWGLWAGLGITALWIRAAEELRAKSRPMLRTAPLLAMAVLPLALNWPRASRAGDYAARDWAYNLLQSVEPYGVLFTNGDNDTFPLWYLQEVEGVRRDVTVIVRSYLNTDWYPKQLRDLTRPCPTPGAWAQDPTRIICQRPFDPRGAPDFYGNPRPPTHAILSLSDAEIDRIMLNQLVLPGDVAFEAQGIRTTLPAGSYVTPADQLLLTIVKESLGDRPIYFSATPYMQQAMGLDAYAERQGVAFKLVTPQQAGRLMAMPHDQQYSPLWGAYFDVERNRKLLDEVFVYRDLAKRPFWPDDATRGIPSYYGYGYLALAQAEAMTGDRAGGERSMKKAEGWIQLANR
ncbi:MAG: DUF2723 domain-containing protein [Gemmatimonadetes bacterium]|nr:DUF2723 domain-containing protein [Gemmatimonadota bacterium]